MKYAQAVRFKSSTIKMHFAAINPLPTSVSFLQNHLFKNRDAYRITAGWGIQVVDEYAHTLSCYKTVKLLIPITCHLILDQTQLSHKSNLQALCPTFPQWNSKEEKHNFRTQLWEWAAGPGPVCKGFVPVDRTVTWTKKKKFLIVVPWTH